LSKIPASTSMHFATHVRTQLVASLYGKISLMLETVQNRTHVHIHIFAWSDRYHDLPEYWPYFLVHSVILSFMYFVFNILENILKMFLKIDAVYVRCCNLIQDVNSYKEDVNPGTVNVIMKFIYIISSFA
jgi:hypothetical protein